MQPIVLLPPDERPNTGGYAVQIAHCFGLEVLTPPAELMPQFMTPAPREELRDWLLASSEVATEALVSLDLLAHGGLIPSRNTPDRFPEVFANLSGLRDVSCPVTAYQVVQRMPPYSNKSRSRQEPKYWEDYGADLGVLSELWHKAFLNEATNEEVASARAAVPAQVREDVMKRRFRNYLTNLAGLELLAHGDIERLVITSDDTSARSLPAADKAGVQSWIDRLELPVLMYPGADEVPSVLMASIALRQKGVTPRVKVVSNEGDEGLNRTPPFEDGPVRTSILRQVLAAGAQPTQDDDADLVLVVHAPDPQRQIWGTRPPRDDTTTLANGTAELAKSFIERGQTVAVADVRYANGGDPRLIWALENQGILTSIGAYSGWNTAGNTIGTALAAGLAAATCTGETAREAQQAFLVRKIIEDGEYLPRLRLAIQQEVAFLGLTDPPLEEIPMVEERIQLALNDWISTLPSLEDWKVEDASLPWRYTFTVDLTLTRNPGQPETAIKGSALRVQPSP